jgi:hypothetical protein
MVEVSRKKPDGMVGMEVLQCNMMKCFVTLKHHVA